MKKTVLLSLALIAAAVAIGLFFYEALPERIASHWGMNGEVDGYMDKALGLFLIPLISLAVLAVFIVIPKIDPLAKNIKEFMRYYEGLIIIFASFMFYLNLLVVCWNLGPGFNMAQALTPGLAALFYYLGVLVSHAKTNWSIGIRTPWTMSSEIVWERTHKLGGRLFKACGVIAVLGLFFPGQAIYLVLAPVLVVSAYLFLYSYMEYGKTT